MSSVKERPTGAWSPDETLTVEHPESLHWNAIDLTGQQFGRLTVVLPTAFRYGGSEIMWLCRCVCDTWTVQPTARLRSGHTQSCGCYRRDQLSRVGKRTGGHNRLDLTDQRFGRLVAVEPTDERAERCVVWKCRCDCGNTHYVKSGHLRSGNIQSCGCSHRSDDPADWFDEEGQE